MDGGGRSKGGDMVTSWSDGAGVDVVDKKRRVIDGDDVWAGG